DDEETRVAARFGADRGFIFVWSEDEEAPRQVRLSYLPPGREERVDIPEAGTIHLHPGGAKILPLGVPVGRGVLRYSTSELAGVGTVGERTLLVVYGDVDTPGELSLRLPGPPLVTGDVTRQRWDAEENALVLDYFHGRDDRYILVDEIQICVLSRERAGAAATLGGGPHSVTLSAGVHLAGGSSDSEGLRATLDCAPGRVELTAALPERPSSVTVDGEPVEFTFTTPDRVVRLHIETASLEQERRARSVWKRLAHAIGGAPPGLRAEFDQGWFMPDAKAPSEEPALFAEFGGPPERLGLAAGEFARVRTHFRASGSVEISVTGSTDPALVFVNGEFVMGLSGSAPSRRADITPLLGPDENEIEMVLQLPPRALGFRGLNGVRTSLPQITVVTDEGRVEPESWEIYSSLAGESAGWTQPDVDVRRWHRIRFGPWREQGRDLVGVRGVGWYRVPFDLPEADGWNLHYRLSGTLYSAGAVYINGDRLAACRGEGRYVLPLPGPPLRAGEDNVVALALYGLGPQTGLHRLAIAADEEHMTRQRVVDIRF
ncbi:MAG: hypothetical protein ACYTFI_25150, partial [Planctomycetota bacterium]